MNRRIKVITSAAALLVLALVSGIHVAVAQQNSKATDIAVVDVFYLLEHAAAAKEARAQAWQMSVQDQKAFKAEVDAIGKAIEAISDRRAVPSEADYQRRSLELQKKANDHHDEAVEREISLIRAFVKAMRKIGETTEEIVSKIIEEQKLSMVLSKSATLGTSGVPDITQEVLTRLDQRLPTVAIELAEADETSAK